MPGEESVKRFEPSNGLDTALYKTIPLPLYQCLCDDMVFHFIQRRTSQLMTMETVV